ncbi:serine O-acetyltransferase [Alteromonas sp. Mac1]|uniref:serine O-acetyltransferase n=1 Tax=Alteromonas sp. Mac1 TaxID=1777491 RepID=UPI00076FF15A|nr:serine acetyltransferase [Alteromonas sp. Mac1]AMJ86445.1 serine acetyltransferase [Alteromonas sp. Mac1]AMJ90304.1 serine acetyltransferase [Alteromonas sp. Mac2]
MQINSKQDYHNFLEADLKALNIAPNLRNKLTHDIWAFQKSLRKLEYFINCKHSPLAKIYTIFMRLKLRSRGRKLGFSIPPNVFGPGLSIAHAGTIVVNSNAIIGSNCRIHVCVNIGADINDGSKAPRIGNDCYIGPGVKAYGDIEIGNNVGIGANAVVNKSFGSNLTIAGVPAKIISQIGPMQYRDTSK